jgi:hypothetical protein
MGAKMKTIITSLAILFISSWLYSQSPSNITYDAGTNLMVATGADICADDIIINGTWSGGGTKCDGPVPVEMTSFTATITTKNWNAELHWETATEVNNYGFEVERRRIQNVECRMQNEEWENVAFVQGSGTSNSPREYSYSDANLPSGRYAYRLKQIDQDGLFKYSQSLEVEIGLAPKVLALEQNYPNPFNPTTTIEFTVPEDGHVSLRVYNSLGQLVATVFDGEAKAGYIQKATFNASRLSSGVYFSRLQYNEKTLLKKLVLMK